MKLIPQTEEEVRIMEKAGFPLCLGSGDWEGDYPRHCNSCIKVYKQFIKKD